jgi:hypothetical protein
MDEPSDYELWQPATSGEPEAFGMLTSVTRARGANAAAARVLTPRR